MLKTQLQVFNKKERRCSFIIHIVYGLYYKATLENYDMVRESFIKFNLNRLKKYNKQIENRHIHNLKKVNELKKAYMRKAIEIKNVNEDIILKKDKVISNLKFQIEFLERENNKLTTSLGEIPEDVVGKYNK